MLFFWIAVFSIVILVGIVVLCCYYGNGDLELLPVDRFARDLSKQPLTIVVPVIPDDAFETDTDIESEEEEEEEEENEEEDEDEDEAVEMFSTVRVEKTIQWQEIPKSKYRLNEKQLDTFLYIYHRHLQKALLSANEREMTIAQQNLKEAVWNILEESIQSILYPQQSSEITNAFQYFLERYCDLVIHKDRYYDSTVFQRTSTWLHEAFSKAQLKTEDVLWLAETISSMKTTFKEHRCLAQDVFALYAFYEKSRKEAGILLPYGIQPTLDKSCSKLAFMMQNSVRIMYEQIFPSILEVTREKQKVILQLLSILDQNLFDFTQFTV
jgi:hypothetical protein